MNSNINNVDTDAKKGIVSDTFEFVPHNNFINFDLVKEDDFYYLVLQIYDATGKIPMNASLGDFFDTDKNEPTNEVFLQMLTFEDKNLSDSTKTEAFQNLKKKLRAIKNSYNDRIMKKYYYINKGIEERDPDIKDKNDVKRAQNASITEFYNSLSSILNLYSPMYDDPKIAKRDSVKESIYTNFTHVNLPDGEAFDKFFKSDNDITYFDLSKKNLFKIKKYMIRSVEDPVRSAHDTNFDYRKHWQSLTNIKELPIEDAKDLKNIYPKKRTSPIKNDGARI